RAARYPTTYSPPESTVPDGSRCVVSETLPRHGREARNQTTLKVRLPPYFCNFSHRKNPLPSPSCVTFPWSSTVSGTPSAFSRLPGLHPHRSIPAFQSLRQQYTP